MRLYNQLILISTLIVSGTVHAQSDIVVTRSGIGSGGGIYFGLGAGNTSYDEAGGDDVSLSVLAGYSLNDILGVELSWNDYGSSEVENSSEEAEASAVLFGVIGTLPLSNEVNAFAQLGIGRWDFESGSIDESDTDVYVGLGIDYAVSHNMNVRFAYQHLPLDGQSGAVEIEETLHTVQAGVIFKP